MEDNDNKSDVSMDYGNEQEPTEVQERIEQEHADVDDKSNEIPFRLLHDKAVAAEIALCSCCSTMDLVAIATVNKQLSVHRLSFQRLFLVSTKDQITALSWRPDGKTIAVGLANGVVSIYDTENGKCIIEYPNSPKGGKITSLSWVEEDQKTAITNHTSIYSKLKEEIRFADNVKNFILPTLELPLPSSLAVGAAVNLDSENNHLQPSSSNKPYTTLNILCVADDSGCVSLRAFGTIPIASFHLSDYVNELDQNTKVAIKLATLTSDLQTLSIIYINEADSVSTLCMLSSQAILTRGREIQQIAMQQMHIATHLKRIWEGLRYTKQCWDDFYGQFSRKVDSLSLFLQEEGLMTTIQEELMILLACGTANNPVSRWLSNAASLQSLSRLERALDTCIQSIHTYVIDHLHRHLEHALFRLTELRGYALWRERFGELGLDPEALQKLIVRASQLIPRMQNLLDVVNEAKLDVKNFILWLKEMYLKICESSSEEQQETFMSSVIDALKLANFLNSNITVDPLKGYFVTDCFGQSDSFDAIIDDLNSLFEATFAEVGLRITRSFSLTDKFYLTSKQQQRTRPLIVSSVNDESGEQCVAFNYYNASKRCEGICVLRYNPARSQHRGVSVCVLDLNESDMDIIDFQFYKPDLLTTLITRRGGSNEGIVGQISIEPELFKHSITSATCASTLLIEMIDFYVEYQGKEDIRCGVQFSKKRTHKYSNLKGLSVSGSRGLGCVCNSTRRVALYDMEDSEEAAENEQEQDADQQDGGNKNTTD